MIGSWVGIGAILASFGCTMKPNAASDEQHQGGSGSPAAHLDTDGEEGETVPTPCESWGTPEVVSTVNDAELDEISGIAVSRRSPGVLWVHEDSGAGPVLTALSTTGMTLATLTLRGASSTDWEDLAIAPCGDADCLWVGDFGDNSSQRTDAMLLRVEEPAIDSADTELEATADPIAYRYAEGPQDAEALVVTDAGQPYVLTKRTDATSHIYRVPVDGSAVAERVSTISTGTTDGLPTATTAADLWPNGSRLLVRGYLYSFELKLEAGGLQGAQSAEHTAVSTGVELQGEAIAYDPIQRVIWHVGEGVNPPLWRIPCEE